MGIVCQPKTPGMTAQQFAQLLAIGKLTRGVTMEWMKTVVGWEIPACPAKASVLQSMELRLGRIRKKRRIRRIRRKRRTRRVRRIRGERRERRVRRVRRERRKRRKRIRTNNTWHGMKSYI